MNLNNYKKIFITEYVTSLHTGVNYIDDKGSAINSYSADLVLIDLGNNNFQVFKNRYGMVENIIMVTDDEMAKLELMGNIK